MNLVLVTHPAYMGSQSHVHFADMLRAGYERRGHDVHVRHAQAESRRYVTGRGAKWAGYFDQYVLFARRLERLAAGDPPGTLYVFCDQALGPLMPPFARRPHVVHCHDLLALRSALGLEPENRTSWTGRVYQRYIRAGFRHARHFISVSEQSRRDLHALGAVRPLTSEVVANGLNHPYRRQPAERARAVLLAAGLPAMGEAGFLLHIGGGQWYKNTIGVVHLYAAYAARCVAARRPVPPLWLVGPEPVRSVKQAIGSLPHAARIVSLGRQETETIEALYSRAAALLFPSLAEGFGWPIAEALACGCPVVTTGEPPMSEVGGPHAHYLPRAPAGHDLSRWAADGAELICRVLDRSDAERTNAALAGVEWTRRFDRERTIERYLQIYAAVLEIETGT